MIECELREKKKRRYIWLGILCLLFIVSLLQPCISPYKYYEQNLELVDLPPILKLCMIDENKGIYIHKDLYPIMVSKHGRVIGALSKVGAEIGKKIDSYFTDSGQEIRLDYSAVSDFKNIDYKSLKIYFEGEKLDLEKSKVVFNISHILGTDILGRDIFTRLLEGIKISFIIGLVSSVVNTLIGIIYGSISGYLGGRIDTLMMSLLNIIYSIPSILLTILLSILLEPGILAVIMVIGLVYWVGMARQVRAGVMFFKQQDFILAQIVLGNPGYKIVLKHMIPNMKEIILTTMIINVQNAIFTEVYLSFLGIGVPAPAASLGTLVRDAVSSFRSSAYQLIVPTVAITLIFVCLDRILRSR